VRIRDLLGQPKDLPATDLLGLMAFVAGMKKEDILRDMDGGLCEETVNRFKVAVDERKQGKPFAYITRQKEFFSESFYVDERVLIPRPETELLVEEALRILEKKSAGSCIMDMGAGSGAIGIILAKRRKIRVLSVDQSRDALVVAAENSRRLGVAGVVACLCSDLFSGLQPTKPFDVIVANLPYVPLEEWDRTVRDVREYEPRLALDGGREGLEVYRRFASEAPRYLRKGGHVLCEIDGPRQASLLAKMLSLQGAENTEIKKDLSGRERVVIGSWKNS
jgi:release factor glutamine methyltransferase